MIPTPRCSVPNSRVDQRIRVDSPFSGRLFTRQDEATGASVRTLNRASREKWLAAALRIEQGAHRLSDCLRLNRLVAVARTAVIPITHCALCREAALAGARSSGLFVCLRPARTERAGLATRAA
jgi:hypothetical protein